MDKSYDELVKRLRAAQVDHNAWRWGWAAEASDAIVALQAHVEELEEENAEYRVAKNSEGDIITQRQWNAMKQHRYTAESERDALRHDIARHVQIAADQAQEIEALRRALHEIAEEWAGAECGMPVTAQEAYAIELVKRMARMASEALGRVGK